MPAPLCYGFENIPALLDKSDSSFDEDDVNRRMAPIWELYGDLIRSRGFRLETLSDAREYYRRQSLKSGFLDTAYSEQLSAYEGQAGHTLCHDAGLVRILFNMKLHFVRLKLYR
jgi:hypothetical protein